jgi:L-iditol 2-dehydrogenase
MRAAQTLTLDSTVTVEIPDPVCGPGEVVCRVLACATCGSDVHGWYVARKLPAVLGHEPVGEVVEIGAGVGSVAPGDVVAIHHHAACGSCRICDAGHETLCPQFRATRLDPGGFAEYVRIQAELVPELLPLDGLDPVIATCTEPLACALRAQFRIGLTPRDTLLVVGAGTSGLLHIAAARAAGVERVFVAEPRADRRERAIAWGAEALPTAACDERAVAAGNGGEPPDRAPHGAVAAGNRGERPDPAPRDVVAGPAARPDVAIVTSHHPDAIAGAAAALGPGGRLCVYAPPEPGAALAVDGGELFLRELTVTASWSAGAADMRAALALLRSGAVRAGELITHRFPLEQTGAALAAQRDGSALKAVVLP